jgi:hypothetical protein
MERVVETTVLLSYQWKALFKTKRVMQRLFLSHQRNCVYKTKEYCKKNFRISMERVVQNRLALSHQLNALLKPQFFSLISGRRCSKQKE